MQVYNGKKNNGGNPMETDILQGGAEKIVNSNANSIRVIAGPGTGKSFSLQNKVIRLLEEGTSPETILAVTFTRTAANDLKKDIHSLGFKKADRIVTCTLHSLCFKILRSHQVFKILGRTPRPLATFNSSGVLQFEAKPLLKDISNPSFGPDREITKRIRAFEAAWARLQHEEPGWPPSDIDRSFQESLENWLRFHRAMFVGEVIPCTLKYFSLNPECEYLNRFEYVLVDEYQDLNKAEQVLIEMISGRGRTMIIGDSNQSIYSFKYAHSTGIHDYKHKYYDTEDYGLSECRRCPKLVVSMANTLISNNKSCHELPLLERTENCDGEVNFVQWNSPLDEINGIVQYIEHLIKNRDIRPKDILVLCPRRNLGTEITSKLRLLEIDAHSFYHEDLLDSRQAQLAFTLLTVLVNPEDRVSLRFWLGFDSPSWNSNAYNRVYDYCLNNRVDLHQTLDMLSSGKLRINNTNQIFKRYKLLQEKIASYREMSNSEILEDIFPANEGWSEQIREIVGDWNHDTIGLRDCHNRISNWVTQPEMPPDMESVRIMSLHKSKGLSSKVVIITSCIEGLIPRVDDVSTMDDLEENRRLFYVAMTRCKEILMVSSFANMKIAEARRMNVVCENMRGRRANTISSRFIGELGPGIKVIKGIDFLRSI